MAKLEEISEKLREYLSLSSYPVGVRVIREGESLDETGCTPIQGRAPFCAYVHRAAQGREAFCMRLENLKCNNAELTLGLRPPRYGDVDLSIKDRVQAIVIGPLEGADVVMLILNPRQAMTAALLLENQVNMRFRHNRAVCGDALVEVLMSGEPRLSMLCVGSRTSGGFLDEEMVLSLPLKTFLELPPKMSKLAAVSRKAQEGLEYRLARLH
jgi:uncharacterized protein (DUF169 family)